MLDMYYVAHSLMWQQITMFRNIHRYLPEIVTLFYLEEIKSYNKDIFNPRMFDKHVVIHLAHTNPHVYTKHTTGISLFLSYLNFKDNT